MKKPSLKSLSIVEFLKQEPRREARIAAAPAAPMPPMESYVANRLCAALHPARQFVKVAEVIERGETVRSYRVVADPARGTESLAYFSAGQYLSVSLKVGNATLTRPYSISSSPKEALQGWYELTVKRAPHGLASNYILDNWTVGTEVEVSAPEGLFTYEPLRDAPTVVGIAGGSGITPFVSLAKAVADGDEDFNLELLYGCTHEKDILFRKELDEIAAKCPRVHVTYVLSADNAEGCEEGHLSAERIRARAPEGEYSVFICGSQGLYRYFDTQLPLLGLRRKFIRRELFGEYRDPSADEGYVAPKEDTCSVTVLLRGETYTFTAPVEDTLLVSIEKQGIPAPAKCRSGECGWCRARLVSGEVYIPASVDGRKLADHDYGYIHPCCTFPLGDVVLEISAK